MKYEDYYNHVPEEVILKVKGATSAQELLSALADEGIELTDEQIEGIAGGGFLWDDDDDNACDDKDLGGDVREGIDEAFVPAAFMNGEDLVDEID